MTGNTVIDSMIPILMATLFGGIISLIPGLISIRYKADEMVISLMMNSIPVSYTHLDVYKRQENGARNMRLLHAITD